MGQWDVMGGHRMSVGGHGRSVGDHGRSVGGHGRSLEVSLGLGGGYTFAKLVETIILEQILLS